MKRLQFCLVVFAVLALSFSAFAQVQFSQITGTVVDPTGAAIANAKVAVTNTAIDLRLFATTNASGNFIVKELPPGVYKISVEAAGFKTVSNTGVTANAGTIEHVDFKLQLGKASEVVEVTSEASAVNTDDSKLSTTVSSTQISNLPLNGRNVYDLMQMAPGAVNVMGVDFENGHNTVVNGVREDFNGFLINGESNKDMSGGANNIPIQDTVAEFQQLTLNMSAQYGSSAGSINNLVTKSGTNSIHGSVWEYVRNSDLDANLYFLNASSAPKPPLHFNQFGFTLGGPIMKDKLFFFGSYQGDRFLTEGTPSTIEVESPEWEAAVAQAAPNSTAALLYNNFKPSIPGAVATTCGALGTSPCTLDAFATAPNAAAPDYTQWLCSLPQLWPIIGVTTQDQTNAIAAGSAGCHLPTTVTGVAGVRSANFLNQSVAVFGSQTQTLGNLFNGYEAMGRLDYDWNQNNRMFIEMNWSHTTDSFGGNNCNTNCTRGFTNPNNDYFPHASFNFVHTFSPTVLNEFRLGYTQNNTQITSNLPGVPDISFQDAVTGFGSYNGYPQYFKDHEYSYGDMVSISHGNHSFKAGVDVQRNLENSLFSVARGSYEFTDPLWFAADTPEGQAAGVNPGFCTTLACDQYSSNPQGVLSPSIRHWRNWEVGAYFQDDWKATKRLTLNMGLRWDFYQRHTEEDNQVTTFILGSGVGATVPGIAGQVQTANAPYGSPGCPSTGPDAIAPNTQILAGICGPGGFAKANRLGPNQYKDFGPRVGFAWDVFGDGKTSMRGGFGISYEGTLYNPLSNSRWNPPYYSFNAVGSFYGITPPGSAIIYGPTTCAEIVNGVCTPSGTPSYTGAGSNPGQGTGAQAVGNLTGWEGTNGDFAFLTGIVLPQGIKDPYVYNFFYGIQREIVPKWVVEANYVGTAGHRLFRSQQINRTVGGGLPAGATVTNNIGETVTGLPGVFPNANYGVLRNWENANNSNYNGFQLSLRKQMSHGMQFSANYTYSHSIDNGSSWHDAATTAAGAAAGDGYSTDNNNTGLDRGNSVFDIRHRLSLNYVYNLPGQNLHGAEGMALGGWSLNGIWSLQSGAHWSPYSRNTGADLVQITPDALETTVGPCVAQDIPNNCQNIGGEWTLDGQSPGVDRPNSSNGHYSQSRSAWKNGWPGVSGTYGLYNPTSPLNYSAAGFPTLSAPCLACVGNLGRNTFTGPGQWSADMALGKTFRITERFNLKFEASAFNIFNRANFLLAVAGGGAHNSLDDGLFGTAGGTLDGRDLQFGLKLLF
ncbi:MAG: carboxypeptidase regulatory-like domain-containing protein [Terriglobales bacterium]